MSRSTTKAKTGEVTANVSTLKVHLGRYLRQVKEGQEVIVLDRQTPVAKIIPFTGETNKLRWREPTMTFQEVLRLFEKNDKRAPFPKLDKTAMEYLEEDRGSR